MTSSVVILGMDRSGTSLLAKTLNGMGLNLGNDLYINPDENNFEGYWEHSRIGSIQEDLQGAFGIRWEQDFLKPLPQGWLRSRETFDARSELKEIVYQSTLGQLWGFKDPRTLRFLPMWQQIFSELNIVPKYVLAIRRPGEVVSSLVRRDGIEPAIAEALWILKNTAVYQISSHLCYVAQYDNYPQNVINLANILKLKTVDVHFNPKSHSLPVSDFSEKLYGALT